MQKSCFQILCLVFIVCSINACRNKDHKDSLKDASPYFTNLFSGNEEAVFRGINFNETPDAVKNAEKSKLYESTSDHLFYEFTYPKDSTPFSEYTNIQYFFNEENQLDIITADIYLTDSLQETKLKNTVIEFYNSRFDSLDEDEHDYPVWEASYNDKKTDKSYKYTIALKELNDDFGISLEYMRE